MHDDTSSTPGTSSHPSDAAVASHRRPTVVVGTDGSDPAREALQWAHRYAAATDSDLRVVCAWEAPVLDAGAGTSAPAHPATDALDPPDDYAALLEARVRDLLCSAEHRGAQDARSRPCAVDVDVRVRVGHPAQVLLDEAAGAELLVVGRREGGGLVAALRGSVGHHLSAHTGVPLVIVPHADHLT